MKRQSGIPYLFLSLVFLVAIFSSLFFGGSEKLSFSDFNSEHFIFWEIRLPKTLTAILAGCSLTAAGLILQVLFRNPLAGPYALGISSGASLMVALVLMFVQGLTFTIFFGKSILVIAALSGSLLVTLLLLMISKRVKSNVMILLIGLMISQVCGALLATIEYFAEPGNLKLFVLWGMGSLSNTDYIDIGIFSMVSIFAFGLLLFFIKPLNVLLLGDAYAHNLGINIHSTRFYLILISSLLTGISTAFCGPIAFVGISMPILSRLVFSTAKQQNHLVSAMLMGSALLLFADALTHQLLKSSNLPVNIITTLIGAPIVLYIMFKNKSW